MAVCEICGTITRRHSRSGSGRDGDTFDSFEYAIQALAPICRAMRAAA
jgi:hypothetical protein